MMRRIIGVHFPQIDTDLMEKAISAFYRMRKLDAVEKKPATRELINWIRALRTDPNFKPKQLAKGDLPYLGVLFKKSQDYHRAQSMLNGRRMN
jgi:MoxR-like ATPase